MIWSLSNWFETLQDLMQIPINSQVMIWNLEIWVAVKLIQINFKWHSFIY
jgi:hypothetical protein